MPRATLRVAPADDTPTDVAPTPERKAYTLARAAHREAERKVCTLRSRLDGLGHKLTEQHRTVSEATDRMIAAPDDTSAQSAFEDATATIAALQAQETALRDRAIPGAEAALEEAKGITETAWRAVSHADFLSIIRSTLLPADQRFIDAIQALASALADCDRARLAIRAHGGFLDFYKADWTGQPDKLSIQTLNLAVPRRVVEFIRGFGLYSEAHAAPELMDFHKQVFGLED